MKILPLILVSLLASSLHTPAADKWDATIAVTVTSDPDTTTQMTSYLKRELRSLGDVTVKDKDTDYSLAISALKVKNLDNQHIGYAFSYLLTAQTSTNLLSLYTTPRQTQLVADYIQGSCFVLDHSIRTCSYDGLRQSCQQLITRFDTGLFETSRKWYAQNVSTNSPAVQAFADLIPTNAPATKVADPVQTSGPKKETP